MDIDGRFQGGGAFPKHFDARIIEIHAIGCAIDHDTGETKLRDAALEFVSCCFGILHGDMGEAAVAFGVFGDFLRQKIIHLAGALNSKLGIFFGLHAGAGKS